MYNLQLAETIRWTHDSISHVGAMAVEVAGSGHSGSRGCGLEGRSIRPQRKGPEGHPVMRKHLKLAAGHQPLIDRHTHGVWLLLRRRACGTPAPRPPLAMLGEELGYGVTSPVTATAREAARADPRIESIILGSTEPPGI